VFNLEKKINEDVLQHLKFFTEFGRIAFEDAQKNEKNGEVVAEKPFQKLQVVHWTN
jgi:hypothetical protein